ncbi:hypothetical protein IG631_13147 [Alternaria alternata]|nr:hypothetical protein IG631_13147 [Alternaria alternata]
MGCACPRGRALPVFDRNEGQLVQPYNGPRTRADLGLLTMGLVPRPKHEYPPLLHTLHHNRCHPLWPTPMRLTPRTLRPVSCACASICPYHLATTNGQSSLPIPGWSVPSQHGTYAAIQHEHGCSDPR